MRAACRSAYRTVVNRIAVGSGKPRMSSELVTTWAPGTFASSRSMKGREVKWLRTSCLGLSIAA